jgi:virginiamycin A acetyltransferase
MIVVNPTARISSLADIEDSVRGSLINIGAGVVIDAFVKIKPVGGIGNVVIGAYSTINSGCVIYSGNGVNIGQYVAIAANCTFAATNHAYKDRNSLIKEQGFLPSRGGIIVEDDVWIGANCVLLDGAILRRGVVVGAGSLVRSEIPAYAVAMGQPAVVKSFRE